MNDIFLGYPPDYVIDWLERKTLSEPFCIEALEDGTVNLAQIGDISVSLICSLDNENWSDWNHTSKTALTVG